MLCFKLTFDIKHFLAMHYPIKCGFSAVVGKTNAFSFCYSKLWCFLLHISPLLWVGVCNTPVNYLLYLLQNNKKILKLILKDYIK